MRRTLPSFSIAFILMAMIPLHLSAQDDSTAIKSRIVIKSQVQVGNDKKEKIIERHIDGNEDISLFLDSMFGNNNIRFNTIEILRQQMDDMPRMLDSLFEELSEMRGLNMDFLLRQLPATNSRPFLGIVFEDMISEEDEAAERKGIIISRVVPGSAAEEAGLQAGDILLFADEQHIKDIPTIQQIVGSKKIGDKISLQFERDGHLGSAVATLKAKEEGSSSWGNPMMPEMEFPGLGSKPKCDKIILQKSGPKLGISITNLTEEARRDLRVKKGGVLITKVEKGSSAGEMGLSVNDVIVDVNGHRINSPEQLKNLVSNIPLGSPVEIEYIRYGKKKRTSGSLNEYSRAWD